MHRGMSPAFCVRPARTLLSQRWPLSIVDQTADSRLGASSKPRHDRRVISRFVRAERTALHHSRACKLAWPTLDRLSVAICPKRFSGGKCHEDHPKSKFHARGRENSPGIEETTLIDPR